MYYNEINLIYKWKTCVIIGQASRSKNGKIQVDKANLNGPLSTLVSKLWDAYMLLSAWNTS